MTKLLLTFSLAIAIGGTANASPILSLNPITGDVIGAPGTTTGWGFFLSSDSTDWISITSVFILSQSAPAFGTFDDLLSIQGGPTNFLFAPNATAWSEIYDGSGNGLGSFNISAQDATERSIRARSACYSTLTMEIPMAMACTITAVLWT